MSQPLFLALLTASAGPAVAQDRPLDHVSVRADVFFYGAHVPIMLGIVDGIYKKHGIDATFATGRGSGTTIQTVANMSDQFGFADGATLVRLAAQGLHAKQIVGILQTGSNSVMTLPDSNITKPQDLNGKTTGFRARERHGPDLSRVRKKGRHRFRQHQGPVGRSSNAGQSVPAQEDRFRHCTGGGAIARYWRNGAAVSSTSCAFLTTA